MTEKLARGDEETTIEVPSLRPSAPGRLPASARLFPGALLRKARDGRGVADGAEDAVSRAEGSSSAALPADVQRRFESSLGADLSGVRVHTGADSATAASAVGARAYTVGNDIHFAEGQYAPMDPFGLHLLAHEVAHTQQQAGGAPHRQHKLEVSSSGDAAELDADRAADAMVAGQRASIGVSGAGIQREESDSGGVQATVTVGQDTTGIGASKDGKTKSAIRTREWPLVDLGPKEVCGDPPLYLSGGVSVKASASASTKDDVKGDVQSNTIAGSFSIEGSGKLLLGAAKEKLGKIGLEGAVTVSLSVPASLTLTSDGQLQVPKDIVMPLNVEVTLALVGEVGDGKTKLGGALTKNLGSLKAGTLTISDSGVHFEHCSMNDLAQAGKDLLWNTAETVLPGGALIQQYEQDKKAREEFDKSTDELEKSSQYTMSDADDQMPQYRVTTSAYAPREVAPQEKYDADIKAAKAAADAAANPFNGARDQSWWQNGAFANYNQGTMHRMKGDQALAQFNAETKASAVDAAAKVVLGEYGQAKDAFLAAQQQQYGKRVSE